MDGEANSPALFHEWLQHRRKALDLTQAELAHRAGCSLGAMRKLETGERRPSKQLAALLAKALEISPEDTPAFIRAARGEGSPARLRTAALRNAPLPAVADIGKQPTAPQVTPALIRRETGDAGGRGASRPRLPRQVTPLVGRDAELAALQRMFNNPQCRLLTLTGIGGIGKTRLAIDFAAQNAAAFPDGVFYVPLTAVDSAEKIVPAIAEVFDFGFSGPGDLLEQLLGYLGGCSEQKALLILDNLEHLLAPASPAGCAAGVVQLAMEILQRLPNFHILGTSRERLNLHGEWTYELHGLSAPPDDYAMRLEAYAAVELFIGSAQRARADFRVTEDETPALVRICRLVEGAPLAIELAAVWAGLLSLDEIADEIQCNLDFLTTTLRDIPERHRSMRAAFDHSWTLLADDEREALRRLAVFHGGFGRDAAQQVAGASLPLLASLSAKSLVRRADGGFAPSLTLPARKAGGQGASEPIEAAARYDLHQVIRQYAAAHLDSDGLGSETRARHAAYYLRMAHDHETQLKRAEQQAAVRRLASEIDNLRAAWGWAVQHRRYDLLEQAGRAFGWYYEVTGLYREGIEQLEAVIQALNAEPPDHPWGRLLGMTLIHQALLHFRQGEFDPAARLYTQGLLELNRVDDRALIADALVYLGLIRYLSGDYSPAAELIEQGRDAARQAQDRWLEALSIDALGYIDGLLGRYDDGYAKMKTGLALFRPLGDPHAISMALNFMMPILIKLGKFEEARAAMAESIALCDASKNRWGMGTAYGFLGSACIAEGSYTEARVHLLKSLEIFREYITGWNIARSMAYLGDACRLDDNPEEARSFYTGALSSALESDSLPIVLDALVGLACLDARAGREEPAAALAAFALDHPASEADTRARAAQLLAELKFDPRRRSSPPPTLEAVVELALSDSSASGGS